MHHDGSNNIIRATNGHNTWIQTDGNLALTKKNAAEYYAIFYADAQVQLRYNNAIKFETTATGVDVTGDLVASGDVTAYSDERLKDNIQTIDGALGKVNSMRGVTYTKDGLESSGVIAQEIEKIAPELVKDGQFKSVAYGNLVGYLIEAIKEQQKQIEQSKTEIDNLKKLIGE
jgi:polyhydroxyalkanoate synthesis regulator phasin